MPRQFGPLVAAFAVPPRLCRSRCVRGPGFLSRHSASRADATQDNTPTACALLAKPASALGAVQRGLYRRGVASAATSCSEAPTTASASSTSPPSAPSAPGRKVASRSPARTRPVARLKDELPRKMQLDMGHPWVYDDEVANISELTGQPAGSVVDLVSASGASMGVGMLNRQASIVVRRIEGLPEGAEITPDLVRTRLRAAIAARERSCSGKSVEFCRVVNGELDGLPGIFVDRFGRSIVLSFESVGSAHLEFVVQEELSRWIGKLEQVAIHRMVAKKEKWAQGGAEFATNIARGDSSRVVVSEPPCSFEFDVHQGLSGHWNYALEGERQRLAQQIFAQSGGTVLDAWSHIGQWGIRCAKLGASEVVLLEDSLGFAKLSSDNATRNDVELQCTALHRSSVPDEIGNMAASGIKFNCVSLSARARFERYYKQRRGQFGRWFKPSLKGYETAAYLAAQVTSRGGYLVLSFLLPVTAEHEALALVQGGLERASRVGSVIHHSTGLGDHAALPSVAMEDAWCPVLMCFWLN